MYLLTLNNFFGLKLQKNLKLKKTKKKLDFLKIPFNIKGAIACVQVFTFAYYHRL